MFWNSPSKTPVSRCDEGKSESDLLFQVFPATALVAMVMTNVARAL